jgi:CRP-like cAMP-binding protein
LPAFFCAWIRLVKAAVIRSGQTPNFSYFYPMEQYLRSFNVLTGQEIQTMLEAGRSRIIKKGEFLISEGQVCREVAFVKSGFFRSFCHTAGGDEITYCFTFAGSFVTAYSSFISGQKTIENVHALADAEVFSIPQKEIIRLENTSPNWLRLSKMNAEEEFMKMEKRVFQLLKENAENRYRDLVLNHPEYLQLIPLSQLASYLGITQRHLSRIRKSVRF